MKNEEITVSRNYPEEIIIYYPQVIHKFLNDSRLALDVLETARDLERLQSSLKKFKQQISAFEKFLVSFKLSESKVKDSSRLGSITAFVTIEHLNNISSSMTKEMSKVENQIADDRTELAFISENIEVMRLCEMAKTSKQQTQVIITETLLKMANVLGGPKSLIEFLQIFPTLVPWDFGKNFEESTLQKRLLRHKKRFHN